MIGDFIQFSLITQLSGGSRKEKEKDGRYKDKMRKQRLEIRDEED